VIGQERAFPVHVPQQTDDIEQVDVAFIVIDLNEIILSTLLDRVFAGNGGNMFRLWLSASEKNKSPSS
jgi:hypothetical protein